MPVVAVVFACARECACDGSLRTGKLSATGNWALSYQSYRQNHVHQAEEGKTRAEPSLPAELLAAVLFCQTAFHTEQWKLRHFRV